MSKIILDLMRSNKSSEHVLILFIIFFKIIQFSFKNVKRLSKKQKKKRKNNKKEALEKEEEEEEESDSNDTEKLADISTPKIETSSDLKPDIDQQEESALSAKVESEISDSKKDKETVPKPSLCSVCNQEFSSRTKLFEHISKEGHAAPKVIEPSQPLSHNALKKNKRLAKVKK